jgi:DNA-binding LytR/AlgR family response regulator
MRILIIEDEKLAAERMQRLLSDIDPSIEVVGVLKSVKDSVGYLSKEIHPEIILADIELSDGQSFEIFKKIPVNCAVIFTTSYNEYALNAFQANSIDYLLKPVRLNELKNSLEKYQTVKQHFINSAAISEGNGVQNGIRKIEESQYRKNFLVKQGQRFIPIAINEIAYFFVEGRVSYIVTQSKQKLLIDLSLEDIEKSVQDNMFYRVNRSFIVNKNAIQKFTVLLNRKLKVELNPPALKEVIVSKEKATDFKKWMGR